MTQLRKLKRQRKIIAKRLDKLEAKLEKRTQQVESFTSDLMALNRKIFELKKAG